MGMEQDCVRGVPGARYEETHKVFYERYVLLIGARILQDAEDVLTCINDPTSAGRHFMLYREPVNPSLWPDGLADVHLSQRPVLPRCPKVFTINTELLHEQARAVIWGLSTG